MVEGNLRMKGFWSGSSSFSTSQSQNSSVGCGFGRPVSINMRDCESIEPLDKKASLWYLLAPLLQNRLSLETRWRRPSHTCRALL